MLENGLGWRCVDDCSGRCPAQTHERMTTSISFPQRRREERFRPVCLSHHMKTAQSISGDVDDQDPKRSRDLAKFTCQIFPRGGRQKHRPHHVPKTRFTESRGHGMSGESGIGLIAFQASLWGSIRDLDLLFLVRGEALRDSFFFFPSLLRTWGLERPASLGVYRGEATRFGEGSC